MQHTILQRAEAILKQLVGFDTVSSCSNLALIEWVENYLDQYGVHHERVQEHTDEGGHKTSLLARIGPDNAGGIVLSGHTDVVPVEGQRWTGGDGAQVAFTLTERDGKFYGRGSADMKGFIALVLAQAPEFVQQDFKRPLWLAFSHDEETGCKCAEPMAQEFIARAIKPQLILVGEPTDMKVVDEHKGIVSFETIITGKEAHSSAPQQGLNAIDIMAKLVVTLNQINEDQHAKPDVKSRFPTPYSSIHVGIISGGKARNIIPGEARICWEVRPLPGADIEQLLAPYHRQVETLNKQIKARFPQCGIVTAPLTRVHGLKKTDPEAPHLALAKYLAGSNDEAMAVSYGTEGGAFGEHGFPTVICGPGSIDQAHQPDEFVSRAQLERGAAMMARIGEVLSK